MCSNAACREGGFVDEKAGGRGATKRGIECHSGVPLLKGEVVMPTADRDPSATSQPNRDWPAKGRNGPVRPTPPVQPMHGGREAADGNEAQGLHVQAHATSPSVPGRRCPCRRLWPGCGRECHSSKQLADMGRVRPPACWCGAPAFGAMPGPSGLRARGLGGELHLVHGVLVAGGAARWRR